MHVRGAWDGAAFNRCNAAYVADIARSVHWCVSDAVNSNSYEIVTLKSQVRCRRAEPTPDACLSRSNILIEGERSGCLEPKGRSAGPTLGALVSGTQCRKCQPRTQRGTILRPPEDAVSEAWRDPA